MPFEISSLTGAGGGALARTAKTAVTGATDAGSFASQLGNLVASVEETAVEANTAVSGMIDKTTDVHDAMIALQRAEQTLQLTVQIRNKLVQAYNEVMRMPV